ncbi:MAG: dNTP triphosphohydrolase [Verrucomicrobia bacterium]|nr:dNTP triphosphohydrolase [Verrucomicrobiota bacterium]
MNNRFYGSFDSEHLPGKRPANDYRSPFQIDRDRVVFSTPFRQLQSKTQVFQSGEYDFYRTRLTHTIEVARICRSITDYLNQTSDKLRPDFYIDPDLVEAVGLAHDLGHPPFGHIGERKLNYMMRSAGGFEGNAQSLRIVTNLIYPRNPAPTGMSPTRAFVDGILKYKALYSECCGVDAANQPVYPLHHFLYDDQKEIRAFVSGDQEIMLSSRAWNELKSIECQIMDWADDTAYSLHDIVDGVRARFITPDRLQGWLERQSDLTSSQIQVVEELIQAVIEGSFEPRSSMRIGQFIQACRLESHDSPLARETNRHRFKLAIDPRMVEVCQLHKRIAVDLIFKSPPLQQIEFKGGHVLESLFRAYESHYIEQTTVALRILPEPVSTWVLNASKREDKYRLLCDHVASLTDGLAVRTYKRLFDADFGSIADFS